MSDRFKAMKIVQQMHYDDLSPFVSHITPVDPKKLWRVLQAVTCPLPCIGYVNRTGWHQECQKRAQEAMKALGFTPPDIDPIPDDDDWKF